MAVARTARVTSIAAVGPEARLLELTMEGEETFGFRGGQYVIAQTGALLPDGKPLKRAYSLASADAEQRRAQLLVKRLTRGGGGPGSAAMHRMVIGDAVMFSGPWGKLAPERAAPTDGEASPEDVRTLVLATDTGITAAMGLLASSAFAPRLASTELVWLTTGDDDFLSEAYVRARIPAACGDVRTVAALAVGHPERGELARGIVAELVARAADRARGRSPWSDACLVGDGAMLVPARDALLAAGLAPERTRVEYFFNAPPRR